MYGKWIPAFDVRSVCFVSPHFSENRNLLCIFSESLDRCYFLALCTANYLSIIVCLASAMCAVQSNGYNFESVITSNAINICFVRFSTENFNTQINCGCIAWTNERTTNKMVLLAGQRFPPYRMVAFASVYPFAFATLLNFSAWKVATALKHISGGVCMVIMWFLNYTQPMELFMH